MRIYVPLTLTSLARALAAGEIGPAPMGAYAVTPALREWYAEGDLEELEYAALTEAARGSLRLIAADPAAAPRRVVLAAEMPDRAVVSVPGGERAAVRISVPIPARCIAAGHVDDREAESDVRAAVKAVAAADAGDPDARFIVDGADGHELQWYASQELSDLA